MVIKCKECGTKIDVDESKYEVGVRSSIICPLCGETVYFTIPKPIEKQVIQASPHHPKRGNYRFCPACGTELAPEIKFCPNCGKEVKVNPTPSHFSQKGVVESEKNKSTKETEMPNAQTITAYGVRNQRPELNGKSSHNGAAWWFVAGGCVALLIVVFVLFLPRLQSQPIESGLSEESMENLFRDISSRQIINTVQNKYDCFIVISKKEHSLKVYEVVGNDTLLISVFPACLSRNKGQKQGPGDMRTPESSMTNPFTICQIQDASTWRFDFGDGRGRIHAYGHWFLRLETGFDGIGIQGSTNNASSVPGRDSSGSIRLKDEDIIYLKENYAYLGMSVIIKQEEEGLFGFEKRCIERLNK